MNRRWLVVGLAAWLAIPIGAAAHFDDDGTEKPNDMAPNKRGNIVPFFEAGDARTRHDSDPDNDDDRNNDETRQSRQRYRDEVRNDGSTGDVGEGCMDQYCYFNLSDDDQYEYIRFDHTLSVGPAAREGDSNHIRARVLGAGALIELGGSQEQAGGALAVPDGEGAGLYDPDSAHHSPDQGSGDPDLEPNAPQRAPESLHFNHSPDHAWLGLAHSSSDHGNTNEFSSHDTHGGSIYADVFLPQADDPYRVRDSKVGNSIIEHLSCPTCVDEYHEVWVDPERTIFQAGEIAPQTEATLSDTDTWLWGQDIDEEDYPMATNEATGPAAEALFDNDAWDAALAANSSATGVGEANSLCCAPAPDGPYAGRFCNRNLGGGVWSGLENQAIVGCSESPSGDCIGGAANQSGVPEGCVVVGGTPFYLVGDGVGSDPDECTRRAVQACCENGGCL